MAERGSREGAHGPAPSGRAAPPQQEDARPDPRQSSLALVRADLERLRPQFEMAIPRGTGLNPERMVRLAMTVFAGAHGAKLLECTKESILGSVMMAAQLGLEIGTPLGQASLVPYKVKSVPTCQLIVEYRGMIDLARRSGRVGAIDAVVVHARDEFRYERGLEPRLVHVPCMDAEPGPPVAVYAVCRFTDGTEPQFDVMLAHEVEAVRQSSRSAGFEDSPWNGPFREEMWRKTMIRRAFKLWPVGTAARVAARRQEMLDAGLEPEPVPEGPIVDAAGEDQAAAARAVPRPTPLPAPRSQASQAKPPARGRVVEEPTEDPDSAERATLVGALTNLRSKDPEAYAHGFGLANAKGEWDPKRVKFHTTHDCTLDQLREAADRADAFIKRAGAVDGASDDGSENEGRQG